MKRLELANLGREAQAYFAVLCLHNHDLFLPKEFIRDEIERLGLLRMSDSDFKNFVDKLKSQPCQQNKLQLKADQLLAAAQDRTPDIRYFLDTKTGQVLKADCRKGFEVSNDELRRKLEAEPDRYRWVEPLTEADIEWARRDFVERLTKAARERFNAALESRGPAPSFEEAIVSDPTLRARWLRFYRRSCKLYILEWLEGEGIDAELV